MEQTLGRTLPSISMQMNIERNVLTNFRRALWNEVQQTFAELLVHILKHLMAINEANH
jgi:hypothetical protein